jgi:hypothetical protein
MAVRTTLPSGTGSQVAEPEQSTPVTQSGALGAEHAGAQNEVAVIPAGQ